MYKICGECGEKATLEYIEKNGKTYMMCQECYDEFINYKIGEYQRKIKREGDHILNQNENIVCPYCGYEHQEGLNDSEVFFEEGNCESFICTFCENDFFVDTLISYRYTTKKEEK